ncbi:hypothetical protein FRC10_000610 [Ceratobasidium sp. 414]|nr:hypothetical protein FRC10_000610 [Ceratobasidium sp. 414]
MQDYNQQPQQPLLDEGGVCRGFDYFVRSAIAEAKGKGLVSSGGLDSGVDLSIVGPMLCLYHAALRSETDLPSVQLPHFPGGGIPKRLQASTCPFRLLDLFSHWAGTVPHIRDLSRPYQIDLERIICNQPPFTVPPSPNPGVPPIDHIANHLRSIASGISRYRLESSQYTSINSTPIVTTSLWPELSALPPTPYGVPYQAPMNTLFPLPQPSRRGPPRPSPRPSPRSSPRYGPSLGLPEQGHLPRLSTAFRSPSPSNFGSVTVSPGSRNDQGNFIGGFVHRRRSSDPSLASTGSQMRFLSPAPFGMPDFQTVPTLFRDKIVGHAPSRGHDIDDMTGSTNYIAAVISSNMSISDIITSLGHHGCRDLSHQLDLNSCTARPVSRGGFSDIYSGRLYDGTRVAIKTIVIHGAADDKELKNLKRTARELHTWSKCEHPNVARLLGLAEFRGQIAMVSLWMENGDLRTYINQHPSVDRFELSIQIAGGLAYLHSIGIIHGNLKGPDVLISGAGTATLIDFGNAVLGETTLQFTQTATNNSLTPRWTAPEIFAGEKRNNASDVYSLGMEAFTGKVPHSGKTDPAVINAVVNDKKVPDRPQEIPTNVAWGDMLWNLLLQEVSQARFLSAPGIISHLCDNGCEDLSGTLNISTCSRLPMVVGGHCGVYFGELVDHTRVAVRAIDEVLRIEKLSLLEHVARELRAWSKCSHPNVVHLLGLAYFREQVALLSSWMENGDLQGYIDKHRDVDRYKLIHGDIKAVETWYSPQ